jgi:hypothetical protein
VSFSSNIFVISKLQMFSYFYMTKLCNVVIPCKTKLWLNFTFSLASDIFLPILENTQQYFLLNTYKLYYYINKHYSSIMSLQQYSTNALASPLKLALMFSYMFSYLQEGKSKTIMYAKNNHHNSKQKQKQPWHESTYKWLQLEILIIMGNLERCQR